MGKIHVLPEHVANKIAAGEVVERPASVVKELLENALDAGARRIHIQVEAGGKKLIKITDDGIGMVRDDAMLAFERHATSKLTNTDDLLNISTLGFRGEALPSIASVSRVTLETSARMQEGGGRRQGNPDPSLLTPFAVRAEALTYPASPKLGAPATSGSARDGVPDKSSLTGDDKSANDGSAGTRIE